MTRVPIRVLVAEGTAAGEPLVHLLRGDASIEVVGAVADGRTAVSFVRRERPDLVLISLDLPYLDGFEATRRIMEEHPVPIVICSGTADPGDRMLAFRAMEAGALSCVRKPDSGAADYPEAHAHLLQTVKLMAELKVVRRWAKDRRRGTQADRQQPPANGVGPLPWGAGAAADNGLAMVGIGASTGGPPVLQAILGGLPKHFPAPIVVVQHISRGFLGGLVDWLGETTGLRVVVASHGCQPLPGHVYLAPDDFHLGVMQCGRLFLSHQRPENGVRPSVSFLFRTLAQSCGPRAVGVLLSGMGRDGAAELKLMRDRGCVTVAQDRESSVIHGMPGEAIAAGAATHVLAPDRIAELLVVQASLRGRDAEGKHP